jgi:hypothetical protein
MMPPWLLHTLLRARTPAARAGASTTRGRRTGGRLLSVVCAEEVRDCRLRLQTSASPCCPLLLWLTPPWAFCPLPRPHTHAWRQSNEQQRHRRTIVRVRAGSWRRCAAAAPPAGRCCCRPRTPCWCGPTTLELSTRTHTNSPPPAALAILLGVAVPHSLKAHVCCVCVCCEDREPSGGPGWGQEQHRNKMSPQQRGCCNTASNSSSRAIDGPSCVQLLAPQRTWCTRAC